MLLPICYQSHVIKRKGLTANVNIRRTRSDRKSARPTARLAACRPAATAGPVSLWDDAGLGQEPTARRVTCWPGATAGSASRWPGDGLGQEVTAIPVACLPPAATAGVACIRHPKNAGRAGNAESDGLAAGSIRQTPV
jgi:hypothetical protein